VRIRIKICGITREEDAVAAARCGADAIGCVFAPDSPRYVTADAAAALLCRVPPFVTKVAVFVDPTHEWVTRVLRSVPVDVLQFQGDEPPEFCESFAKPYVKTLRVRKDEALPELETWHTRANALLLDTFVPGRHGGTGEVFDWKCWPRHSSRPLILAGGLDVSNVGAAIRALRPWAVDVSGGVEGVSRGEKDPRKIGLFIDEAHRAANEI